MKTIVVQLRGISLRMKAEFMQDDIRKEIMSSPLLIYAIDGESGYFRYNQNSGEIDEVDNIQMTINDDGNEIVLSSKNLNIINSNECPLNLEEFCTQNDNVSSGAIVSQKVVLELHISLPDNVKFDISKLDVSVSSYDRFNVQYTVISGYSYNGDTLYPSLVEESEIGDHLFDTWHRPDEEKEDDYDDYDPKEILYEEYCEECEETRKYIYQDLDVNRISSLEFEHGSEPFHEGIALVKIGGKFGFMDRSGSLIIEPQFDAATSFWNGIAWVSKDKEYFYIDKNGVRFNEKDANNIRRKNNPTAKPIEPDNSTVYVRRTFTILGERYGLEDEHGNWILKPAFLSIFNFCEDLARIEVEEKKYGFVNTAGEIVFKPVYNNASYFRYGIAYFQNDDKWQIIDKNGNVICDDIHYEGLDKPIREVAPFCPDGYGLVSCSNADDAFIAHMFDKKDGIIDRSGRFVIPPIYDDIYPYSDSVCIVSIDTDDGYKHGLMDFSGRCVANIEYDLIRNSYSDPLGVFQLGSKYGYFDKSGNIVFEPKFDSATQLRGDLAIVGVGDKKGVINSEGRFVIPMEFDDVRFPRDIRHINIKKDNKWGVADREGNILVEPISDVPYDDIILSEGIALIPLLKNTDVS